MQIETIHNNNTCFQGYIKFHDKTHKIKKLRTLFKQHTDDYLCANYQKANDKATLEVLSGKHIDKFLDLVGQCSEYRELRTNLTKYLGEKPKKGNVNKYIKKLDKKA